MPENNKIGFVGGGRMCESIVRGIIQSGGIPAENIFVTDADIERLRWLSTECGVSTMHNDLDNSGARQLAKECGVLIPALKPQVVGAVLPAIAEGLTPDTLVISIMGGVPLSSLEAAFPENPVIRVMPNTPMMVRKGIAGLVPGTKAGPEAVQYAKDFFSLVGSVYIIPEKWIDSLTGISGCGPAYAYLFIEALADGGVEMGLPRDLALALASQTLAGAGEMQLQTGWHPGALKDSVTSPGGGTIAGVHALEEGAFRASVMNAVVKSAERMAQLAEDS
ncbi:pyrroline-5-carboxylate reductase [Ruminococcaceae bacterium OttesenSCG-928-I18]|nr:pyrroline-5-carboxylate reductase [Ruminococcaceae bacterium OttesenSCG-928-I18]